MSDTIGMQKVMSDPKTANPEQITLSEHDLLWLVVNECDGEVVIDAKHLLSVQTGTLTCRFSDDRRLLVITASVDGSAENV
jgi:hypothetical protein